MSLFLSVPTIILIIVTPILGYLLVKRLFQKDTEVEDRRRAAAQLAMKLQAIGLKKLPDFLVDYSVGDYSGMAHKIRMIAEMMMQGDAVVIAEVDTVFRNVLDAKLATDEGRAFLAAKLAEAEKIVEASKAATGVVAATASTVVSAATAA